MFGLRWLKLTWPMSTDRDCGFGDLIPITADELTHAVMGTHSMMSTLTAEGTHAVMGSHVAMGALAGMGTHVVGDGCREVESISRHPVERKNRSKEGPAATLREMLASGRLRADLPELAQCDTLVARNRKRSLFQHSIRVCEVIAPQLHLRLAGLLHDIGKPRTLMVAQRRISYPGHAQVGADMAGILLARLGYEADMTERVAHLVRHHMFQLHGFMSEKAIRRWISTVGPEHALDLIELRRADTVGSGEAYWMAWDALSLLARRVRAELSVLGECHQNTVRLAVDGNDVMSVLNLGSGPEVGEVLRELESIVEGSPTLNKRDELLRILLQKRQGVGR